jgi:murein DD-endopeptidase MepM/ murein hydrolase activator NlpD
MTVRTILMIAALLAGPALAATAHSPWPGGIGVLRLFGDAQPIVTIDDNKVLTVPTGHGWDAIFGIPLDHDAPGTLRVLVSVPGGDSYDVLVPVAPNDYEEQRLNVDRKYVEPSQTQLDRIFAEREIIDEALTRYRESDVATLQMNAPVGGRRSSSFGLRRFFNDQPRSPHKGMDIAAVSGTPIVAPLAGEVSATGDFYFNGNTVIVDHGQGFVSLYCHLSEISVETGAALEVGATLGEVGATGRVTGAHLHFATYLNGTAVDPALFLSNE